MKKLKIYLDTSILNFVFDEESPMERKITNKLFEQIHEYDPYISDIVLEEINRCPEPRKKKMVNLIRSHPKIFRRTMRAQAK